MSAKETQNTAVKTTTHYWGYRELDASELKHVGGGDDGGDCGGGDCGGGDYGGGDYGGWGGGYDGYCGEVGSTDGSVAGSTTGYGWVDQGLCNFGFTSFCSPSFMDNTATIGIRG